MPGKPPRPLKQYFHRGGCPPHRNPGHGLMISLFFDARCLIYRGTRRPPVIDVLPLIDPQNLCCAHGHQQIVSRAKYRPDTRGSNLFLLLLSLSRPPFRGVFRDLRRRNSPSMGPASVHDDRSPVAPGSTLRLRQIEHAEFARMQSTASRSPLCPRNSCPRAFVDEEFFEFPASKKLSAFNFNLISPDFGWLCVRKFFR